MKRHLLLYAQTIAIVIISSCVICRSLKAESCGERDLQRVVLNSDTNLRDLVGKFVSKVTQIIKNNDPYQINHVDLNYNGYGLETEGYFENMILSFMATTSVNNIIVDNTTSSLDFGFDLNMEQFQVIGTYKLDFNFLTMLPLYGGGDLGLLLKGIGLSIRASLKEEADSKLLQMSDFSLRISLKESKVEIQNLFNKEETGAYLSLIVSDILPATINATQKFSSVTNSALKSILNSVMCSTELTLDQIIKVMQQIVQ